MDMPSLLSSEAGVGGAGVTGVLLGVTLTGDLGPLLVTGELPVTGACCAGGVGGVVDVVTEAGGVVAGGLATDTAGGEGTGSVGTELAVGRLTLSSLAVFLLLPLRLLSPRLLTNHPHF